MIIIPAIDLINGEAVRLVQGDYNQKTVYDKDPVKVAIKFVEMGAQKLHLVDLDGAKAGHPVNTEVLEKISKEINIPIEIGGGIRNIEDIEKTLKAGADEVILGTSVIKNPEITKKALNEFGKKIVIGIDAKNGKVAISGWLDTTDVDAITLAQTIEKYGAQNIIYTDISKDGMMQGPNYEALKKLAQSVSLNITASGGVSSINNVKDLIKIEKEFSNINACIIGKALYTQDIDLNKAIQLTIF